MFQPPPPRQRVSATFVAAVALALGYAAVVVGWMLSLS